MKNNSIYKIMTPEEIEALLCNYLISTWSYSKVTSFARNEKAFEKNYIFGVYSKSSPTTIAGQAYHHALEYFFTNFKEGNLLDVVELEASAFSYIDNSPANTWKIQKTTPTIEECQKKAYSTVSALLRNFIAELSTYTDDIAEVIDIELRCEEFLTINGVDMPLPCSAKIDMVVKTKSGKIAVVDHKSKTSYTPDEEIKLSIGVQAITYVKSVEESKGVQVDEVWFMENKHSKNKDGSAQINAFKLEMDDNARKLYEALLYEPLRRMLEATSNPDYLYLINDSDNFEDKAELYDFWARTMYCEVADFNIEESKKELVSKRLKKIRDSSIQTVSPNVFKKFSENASQFIQYDLSNKNMTTEKKIEHSLRTLGVIVNVAHKFEGYSSNTYLLEFSAGVKVSSVYNKRLDIANALDVANVRISSEMVVHEGKSYLAVEFSKKRDKTLAFDENELNELRIPIGKDNFGKTIVWDLKNHSTTNMLVCGQVGSGKSVLITTVIEYGKLAGVEEIIIFDPKFEFTDYDNKIDTFVYNDILEIENKMAALVTEMERRIREKESKITLVIFDEFADAVANARSGAELDIKEMVQVGEYAPKKHPMGFMMSPEPKMALRTTSVLKSLEENLGMLLQKGRSSGFRVLPATQRASVKIIKGDIKVNLPVQVCFKVPKEVDSKVVLDEAGAESLAGQGDGLFKSPEYNNETIRFQAFYKPATMAVA